MDEQIWSVIEGLIEGFQEVLNVTVMGSWAWDPDRAGEGAWKVTMAIDDPNVPAGVIGGYVIVTDTLLAQHKEPNTFMQTIGRHFATAALPMIEEVE